MQSKLSVPGASAGPAECAAPPAAPPTPATAATERGGSDGDIGGDVGGEITQWLHHLNGDAASAGGQLFTLLYGELHRMARKHMHGENPGHTLSATALTHEAWFRMSEQNRTHWRGRAHFLAVSSTMMRRILVNHAMAKRTEKRDAALVSLTITEAGQIGTDTPADVVAVHDALLAFEQVDARAAKVVELKFFGGLENEEIALTLEVSLATVKRDWALARAWLHRELKA